MVQGFGRAGLAALGLLALAGCQGGLDLDMRDRAGGFSTADAAMGAVAAGPVAPVAAAPVPDFLTAAGAAIDQAGPGAGPVTTTALTPVAAVPLAPVVTSASSANVGGTQHSVVRGETAYSIARLYGVPVRSLAEANGLGADLGIREGQVLAVPSATGAPAMPVTQPGQGSPTPVPPSASAPLPEEEVEPASATPDPAPVPQDMAEQQTVDTSSNAALAMPVAGPIIRAYAPGRNEGIDIGAAAGTEVRAAEAGTVAAVTTNTDGVQIVVIKHAGDLLTVYTHLEVSVAKDQAVTRGQAIGRVRAGEPSFLHFEVRRGMESQDPTGFLP
jgi:murein DD-endopeptidase MepM/ murein hydrolase activator NlpD